MANKGEKKALRGRAGRMQGGRGSGRATKGAVRLWGRHAVIAAMENPHRSINRIWATHEMMDELRAEGIELPPMCASNSRRIPILPGWSRAMRPTRTS